VCGRRRDEAYDGLRARRGHPAVPPSLAADVETSTAHFVRPAAGSSDQAAPERCSGVVRGSSGGSGVMAPSLPCGYARQPTGRGPAGTCPACPASPVPGRSRSGRRW
jgi:hypothetical protein